MGNSAQCLVLFYFGGDQQCIGQCWGGGHPCKTTGAGGWLGPGSVTYQSDSRACSSSKMP